IPQHGSLLTTFLYAPLAGLLFSCGLISPPSSLPSDQLASSPHPNCVPNPLINLPLSEIEEPVTSHSKKLNSQHFLSHKTVEHVQDPVEASSLEVLAHGVSYKRRSQLTDLLTSQTNMPLEPQGDLLRPMIDDIPSITTSNSSYSTPVSTPSTSRIAITLPPSDLPVSIPPPPPHPPPHPPPFTNYLSATLAGQRLRYLMTLWMQRALHLILAWLSQPHSKVIRPNTEENPQNPILGGLAAKAAHAPTSSSDVLLRAFREEPLLRALLLRLIFAQFSLQ
ncbi:unnamed protein product, partial [Protopolystoma xenopodis]